MNDGDDAPADETAGGSTEGSDDTDGTEWPASLSGVTETVVTTLGPNDRWNVAVLGAFAGDPVTAKTWGNTRTRRNFHRRGDGYVQFVDDPVVFADAALSIVERDDPVLETATAWARVTVECIDSGTDAGTEWEQWTLEPVDTTVERPTVPTIDRGFGAVVEATVAASRLEVDGYDESQLRDRLEWYESVVDRAGGPREQTALERVRKHSSW